MADPYLIPRPAMFPMALPCRMTTQDDGRLAPVHTHRAYPDRAGNGTTDIVASHFHYIRNGEIVPSPIDGHTHRLTNLSCGAGQ